MGDRTSYIDGHFCWIDLASSDPEKSLDFFSQVFGWSFQEMKGNADMVYTLCLHEDKRVCAVYQLPPFPPGTPAHWMSYINVKNIFVDIQKWKAAGGSIMVPPIPVEDKGMMAHVIDPTGARVALWQSKEHFGSEVVNEKGTWIWNELITNDCEKAKEFYKIVFGWSYESEGDDNSYHIIRNQTQLNGGITARPEQMPAEAPNYWGVYFNVENCEETVEQIKKHGGACLIPPFREKVGMMSVVQEPSGAIFSIIASEMVDD